MRQSEAARSDNSGTPAEPLALEAEIHTNIINCHSKGMLLPAFQFYRILVPAYRQKPRPLTYAGTVESKIRGSGRTPASDADFA